MLIIENISLAISGLWSNKMRALLTMLGIIIGIGSVIAIVTVGNSMTKGLSESMQSFGANNLQVYLNPKPSDDPEDQYGYMMEEKDRMSDELIEEYKREFVGKAKYVGITEYIQGNEVKAGQNATKIYFQGANRDYIAANNVDVITGRNFNEKDEDTRRKSIILSDTACVELFGSQDPIGKKVDIKVNRDTHTFQIVGVYEFKQGTGMFSMGNMSTTAYIPLATAKSINGGMAGYDNITITSEIGIDANTFMMETNEFFARKYEKNKTWQPSAFSMQDMVEEMENMMGMLSTAISAIAAISLLVGGIGVMNIMLVSITERTREIGTRKALGATNGSIRMQFIVESIIICLLGGIIGIAVGLALGAVGSKLVGFAAQPSLTIIAIAVAFSMAIGVFFGYYPANKAAKLDPIEALRYE